MKQFGVVLNLTRNYGLDIISVPVRQTVPYHHHKNN